MVAINCPLCGHENAFDQPYPYHAGFGNQGFLYNDAGDHTLVWDSYDPSYQAIVGRVHPWTLSADQRALVEAALIDAPSGGRWRFANPARCLGCSEPISGPMTETIYYLLYPESIVARLRGLREVLAQRP